MTKNMNYDMAFSKMANAINRTKENVTLTAALNQPATEI